MTYIFNPNEPASKYGKPQPITLAYTRCLLRMDTKLDIQLYREKDDFFLQILTSIGLKRLEKVSA